MTLPSARRSRAPRTIRSLVHASGLGLAVAACGRGPATGMQPGATVPVPAAAPVDSGTGTTPPTTAPTTPPPRAAGGARPTAVIMNASFYGKSANSIEPGDTATAEAATARMWQLVREAGTLTLVDSARVATLGAQTAEMGRTCNTSIACARKVGEATNARWVVMSKVSKTSNLIWYFSGQVIEVATGKLLMDDEFELKGVRDEIVPLGARALARRVVRVTERAMAPSGAAGAP